MKMHEVMSKFNEQIEKFSDQKDVFCKRPGRDFSRSRKQSFQDTILTILSLNGGSLRNEILKKYRYSADSPSAPAFIQQRSKLSDDAMPFLFRSLNEEMNDMRLYEGYRLIAVDGSHIHVPNNPHDVDSFVQNRPDEHFHNEFHLNVFWDILQGTFVDAVVQKYRTQNEDQALIEMAERNDSHNSLVICDRGYESYNNIAHLQEAEWKYLIRIKDKGGRGIADGLDFPDDNEFDMELDLYLTRKKDKQTKPLLENRNMYRWIPSGMKMDYLPLSRRSEPAKFFRLRFRIVRIRVSDELYEVLLTNLDAEEFPPHKLGELYRMRWGVETSFRNLKYAVGMLAFHSRKSEFVMQEIYAGLIIHNMTAVVSMCVTIPEKERKYEYRISFSLAACITKSLIAGDASPPAAELLILRNLIPLRPSRKYQRKKTPLKASIQFIYRIA